MASGLETVELDQIQLPPIPGPLPPTFFTDIPPGSAAIFSSLLGTRPFRSLSNPVPVRAIRSGSENDIRDKSYDLFKRHLAIAESIITPPTTWQDLYHYFDAIDLWTEGAGFLFHVLGYIVRVNVTKFNFLESFAREWAFSNEARLANIVPRQDILSSLQTPDDQAWFDYKNLTSHDKEILNSILKWHCEAFQVKRISPPAVALNGPVQAAVEAQRILSTVNLGVPVQVTVEAQRVQSAINSSGPIQMVVEAQRIPYNMPADPYQHFGRPDYKIFPQLANKPSQPLAMPSGNQPRADFNPPYRYRNTNNSYGEQRGSFYENPHQATLRNVPRIAENHYVPLDNYHQFANNRRQSPRGGLPLEPIQRQPSAPNDPVYVLNPHKSLISLHKEVFGVDGSNYIRTSPVYSSKQPQNVSFQRRSSQDRREEMQYANHTFIISNDATSRHSGIFHPVDGGARSMPREHFKHIARKISWPESDFNKVRTVYVTGFLVEASPGHYLEKLFSDCGEIINISVVYEKFCAFITFKDPSSALAAINRFDGYSMEGGKSLTVRYSKGTRRKRSYGNADVRQLTVGTPVQTWAYDLPSASTRNGGYDGRENRDFIRTTPPRNHVYSLSKPSHALPPNPLEQARDSATNVQVAIRLVEAKYLGTQVPGLPAKPQYPFVNSTWNGSPSAASNTHLNCIQSPMQTSEKSQYGASSGQMSTTRRKDSVERSGQSGGRRPYGSENSKTQWKTPKKQKGFPSDRKILATEGAVDELYSNLAEITPTYSPVKRTSPTSTGTLTEESRNANLVSSIFSPVISTRSKAHGNLFNSRASAANDIVLQIQDSPGCSTECPQMGSSTSNSDARSDSVSSTGPNCYCISGQPSSARVDTISIKNALSSRSVPATAPNVTTMALVSFAEPPVEPKELEITAELVQQPKKKKPKTKRRTPNQSSRSSMETIVDSIVPPTPGSHLNNGTMDRSKAEAGSHSKTNSNTTSSNTASSQFMSSKTETAVSPTQITKNGKAHLGSDTLGGSTPPDVPKRQPNRTKKSIHSRSDDGDNLFQDTKPPQDAKRLNQGKIDINGSATATPSTSKSKSSKKARSSDCDESQTPTRKPQPKHRNNKSDSKASGPNRKENKKLSQSPTEILSDPANWPALGSTKLQLDTKSGSIHKAHSIAKPLSERALSPVPIRRDSMASVISQPPQVVRCLTTDSPNSPVSGGSQLWPIVKRWDGHG